MEIITILLLLPYIYWHMYMPMYLLVVKALHGQDGHVVTAAGMQRAGQLAAALLHLVGPVHSLLDKVLCVETAAACTHGTDISSVC